MSKSVIFELLAMDHASEVFRRVGVAATETGAAVEKSSVAGGAGLARMASIGRAAFLGIAGAGAAAAVVSVKMAGDFQKQMTLLQTGAGEAQKNIKMVSDGILTMAGSTGTSAQELAKGMYLIESAGYHGADGLKVLRAAAEGAKTDGADLAVVGDALTTVMTDMHTPTSQAADVMSKMVAAVASGKMRMDDLAASIHNVLPNAAAMHIPFAQVAGALATMTAQGISADQASQNLNHTIVKLASPTLGMTKAMSSYGLSAQDLSKDLGKNGLTGTFAEIEDAILNHMGPAGLTLRSAFNQSQAAAADARKEFDALPPAAQRLAKAYADGSLSLGDYKKQIKDLPADQANLVQQWKATQDASKGFAAQLRSGGQDAQTFSGALKGILGDQTGLQVALHLTGENMTAFRANVAKISGTTAEAGGHVKDWSEVQKNFNQQIDRAKETVDALAIRLGTALLPHVQAAIAGFSDLTAWLTRHSTVALAAGAAVGALAAAFVGAYAITKAMAAATLINNAAHVLFISTTDAETGAVTASLAAKIASAVASAAETAAIVALYTAEAVAAGASKALAAAQWLLNIAMDANPIGLVVIALVALAAGLVYAWTHSETFRNVVIGAFDAVKSAVTTAVTFVVSFVKSHWELLVGILGGPFLLAVVEIVKHWDAIKSAVSSAVSAVRNFITGGLSAIGSVIGGYFEAAKTAASAALDGLISVVKAIPARVTSGLGNLGGLLLSAGADIVQGLVNGIEGAAGRVTAAAASLADKIPSALKHVLGIASPSKVAHKIGTQVIDGLVQGIESGHSTIQAVTGRVSALIQKYLSGGAEKAAMSNLAGEAKGMLAASKTLTAASNAVSAAKAKLADAVKARNDYASNLTGNLRSAADITGAINTGADATNSPGSIQDFLAEKLSSLQSFSGDLASLTNKGLSSDVISQIAGGGLGNGAQVAHLLANGGDISAVNDLEAKIAAATAQIGNSTADSIYGGDINGLQGGLTRMELQEKRAADRLDSLAEDMGAVLVRELRKGGVKVQVGV